MRVMFLCYGSGSLGIGYLASVLKLNGHQVKLAFDPGIFDDKHYLHISSLSKIFNVKNIILGQIRKYKPELIGFSVVTSTYPWAIDFARTIKKEYGIPIVFGGIHPTSVPEFVLNDACIDYIIRGEGEEAFLELVNNLDQKKDPRNIKNLCFKEADRVIINPLRNLIEDLDSLPFPDTEIFSPFIDITSSYRIMTSRGCMFSCNFCCNGLLSNMYKDKGEFIRKRSVDNFIEELEIAKSEYNTSTVQFEDNMFIFDLSRLEEFSRKYRKRIGLPFKCLAHPKMLNDDSAHLLVEAGCYAVYLGVQTLNYRLRKDVLNRNETNKEIICALEVCQRNSLHYAIDHLFGIPEESEEDYRFAADIYNKNRRFLKKIKCFFLEYFPGTPMVEIGLKYNILDNQDLENIKKGLLGSFYLPNYICKKNKRKLMIIKSFEVFYKLLPIMPKSFCNFLLRSRLYFIFYFFPRFIISFLEFVVAIKNSDFAIIDYLRNLFRKISYFYLSFIKLKEQ